MSLTITLPNVRPMAITYDEHLNNEEFWKLCASNPDLHIEREADGKIKVMSPVGFKTGERENLINAYLTIWAIEERLGTTASPSTGFVLPTGEVRSADASWISDERLGSVEDEEPDRFPELVPDFTVEIRSKSDNLKPSQLKMQDIWIANGVRLGWLIGVKNSRVFICREDGSIEVAPGLNSNLTGEDVLPGFSFDLNRVRK